MVRIEQDIDARINFHTKRTVRGERRFLHRASGRGVEVGRANVLTAFCAGKPRVFAGHVVDPFGRNDVHDRQCLIIDNADGELHAIDELLDEDVIAVLRRIGHCLRGLILRTHDVHADAGAFARWFDNEWRGK